MHTKVLDEAAHTGDPLYKKDQISSLDRGLKALEQVVEKEKDLLWDLYDLFELAPDS